MFPDLYNQDNCGLNGEHYFALKISAESIPNDYVIWQWYLSGNPVGPHLVLQASQDQFARQNFGAISELPGASAAVDGSLAFPDEFYYPGIKLKAAGWITYHYSIHGRFTARNRTCYYALRVDGQSKFVTGEDSVINPVHCHAFLDPLW